MIPTSEVIPQSDQDHRQDDFERGMTMKGFILWVLFLGALVAVYGFICPALVSSRYDEGVIAGLLLAILFIPVCIWGYLKIKKIGGKKG